MQVSIQQLKEIDESLNWHDANHSLACGTDSCQVGLVQDLVEALLDASEEDAQATVEFIP